jgi:hypothetical protein
MATIRARSQGQGLICNPAGSCFAANLNSPLQQPPETPHNPTVLGISTMVIDNPIVLVQPPCDK